MTMISEYELVSPYKDTEQYTEVQVLPHLMNSDIISNMEMILKQKVEKKCNKYGYIFKVYNISDYQEGYLVNEHFLGAANFKVTYNCRMCLPIENTIIICIIHSVNSELIIAKNGPIIIFIPKTNINTNIWEISNNIKHIEKQDLLTPNNYVKVIIDKKKINQNDTQIKCMGILHEFATDDEKEKYYGHDIKEEESKESDNFII